MPYCRLKNCYKYTKLWYKNYKSHRNGTKFWTKITKITETVPNFGQKLQKSQKGYQSLVQKLQKSQKQYKTLVTVLFVYLLSQCRQCSTESADCSPQFSKQQRKRSCLFKNMWFLILNWHYYMWYLLNSTTQKLLKSYRFPFLKFLFRYFKEEAKFYFWDHQCIQALSLGLKCLLFQLNTISKENSTNIEIKK